MRSFMIHRPNRLAAVGVFVFWVVCATATPAHGDPKPKAEATFHLSTDGPSTFLLAGTAPHFGKFESYGEIALRPGETEGTLDGIGVAVLEAANGDLIVGVVSCQLDASGAGQIHFSWRDSVEFSDGTVVSNTGRFVRHRPPGVVIAIIAILLG